MSEVTLEDSYERLVDEIERLNHAALMTLGGLATVDMRDVDFKPEEHERAANSLESKLETLTALLEQTAELHREEASDD